MPSNPSDASQPSFRPDRDPHSKRGNSGSTLRSNIGWGISLLLVMFMMFSAFGKFANFEGRDEIFQRLGWDADRMYYIGVMEVIVALFYLVPQTAFVGALLLTAYLGGAIATHVRVNDPFLFPIAIGVLL